MSPARGVTIVHLTLDNLGDLPQRCRSCVYWELDRSAGERACASGAADLEKEAWLSDTLLEWGSCGELLYVESLAAGFVLFAPPDYVPRSVTFPTSPVSGDAVLLMSAHLLPEFAGTGLGRMLVQAVARGVARRGIRAIEAFGRLELVGQGPVEQGPRDGVSDCVLPAGYLLAVGFKTVRPHPHVPRLRLDVNLAVEWKEKEEVGYAVERLLSPV